MSKQALRHLLRWGGLAVAVIGFVVQNTGAFRAGRVLVWVGLGMILTGIIVRMFIREP